MGIRERTRDPLLGFGWAGCVSAVILLAIVATMVAGVDLRYELLKLIQALFGDDAMINFIAKIPFMTFEISAPAISVVTAVGVMVAFVLAPYRFNRFLQLMIFVICTGWFWVIISYSRLAGQLVFGGPKNGVFSMSGYYFLEIVGVVLVAVLVVCLTRSRLVMILWFLAVAVAVAEIFWGASGGSIWNPAGKGLFVIFDIGHYMLLTLVFDVCTIGSILLWAILERRKSLPDCVCQACGYDLAGLNESAPCPECGKRQAVSIVPPSEPAV